MKTKLGILLLASIFIFAAAGLAEQLSQADSLFYQGNAHYSKEKFKQAIADYEGTLTLGLESGPLYYNLGNAYFKHGSLGKAVLNYLRAQRLMPRDADLNTNLKFARSLIKAEKVVSQRNWFTQMFFKLSGSFRLNELTSVSTILYLGLAVLLILAIRIKKSRKLFLYISYPVLTGLVICACLFFTQFYQTLICKQAVVVVKSSNSKFEPFDSATTYFTLYEGASVIITGSKGDWAKIRRLDGRGGWIKQSDIELL